jgi:hypothetical protein
MSVSAKANDVIQHNKWHHTKIVCVYYNTCHLIQYIVFTTEMYVFYLYVLSWYISLNIMYSLRKCIHVCYLSISHRPEFKYLSHTPASSQPTRELLGVLLFTISLLMCFTKHSFVAIWIVQTVKFIYITLFVTVFQLAKIWRINMQAFLAKSVPTDGIDMYESGSCHHVIYARRMINLYVYIKAVYITWRSIRWI